MSTRYTLNLVTRGKQVWSRYTGDREEALRDLASTMVDLDIGHHRALVFVTQLKHELEANPEGIPAVYALRGRQYVAFAAGASWGTGGDPVA